MNLYTKLHNSRLLSHKQMVGKLERMSEEAEGNDLIMLKKVASALKKMIRGERPSDSEYVLLSTFNKITNSRLY
jgi:hypothetical protein